MLGVVLAVTGLGFLLANPVSEQVDAFRDNVPEIVDDANASLADVQAWLDDNGINVQIAEDGADRARHARPEPVGGLGRARRASPRTRCGRSSRPRWR